MQLSTNPSLSRSHLRMPSARDLLQLSKPGITLMSVLVAAGAMALAVCAQNITGATVLAAELPLRAAAGLIGVTISVAGAGALNQWWERELDARMSRTRNRPVPAGRMDPSTALWFGCILSLGATLVLWLAHPVAAALHLMALGAYVLLYTPMKQRSAWALVVGAVPGAMPATIGYAAVAGVVDGLALSIFAIVFFWQLPHFLAISLYRHKEYAKAGYVVAPSSIGVRRTRTLVLVSTIPLLLASLMPFQLGVAGWLYLAVSVGLGIWFSVVCLKGLAASDIAAWARKAFFGTLIYQTVLFAALGLDVGLAWLSSLS